jgi:dephospho-CoA kinase
MVLGKVVAVVGMTGSGKSEAAEFISKRGFNFIRFGQITLDIVKERGLEPTEENERPIREGVRKQYGMAAYAILNMPKIDKMLKSGSVVIDGVYSWEEYVELKKKYGKRLVCVAIYSPPEVRYKRLAARKYDPKKDKSMRNRPATMQDSKSRDYSEIEKINKAGPIAMADFTIINDGTLKDLGKKIDEVLSKITG